jgi:hypothetical protein
MIMASCGRWCLNAIVVPQGQADFANSRQPHVNSRRPRARWLPRLYVAAWPLTSRIGALGEVRRQPVDVSKRLGRGHGEQLGSRPPALRPLRPATPPTAPSWASSPPGSARATSPRPGPPRHPLRGRGPVHQDEPRSGPPGRRPRRPDFGPAARGTHKPRRPGPGLIPILGLPRSSGRTGR